PPGVQVARTASLDRPTGTGDPDGPAGPARAVRRPTPSWDRDRRELRLAGALVKRVKAPAPNQEAILAAVEEEGWPPRIDDPISPQLGQDPKHRLHDTINALNRHQKSRLVGFLGDGSGQGVRWEFLAAPGVAPANGAAANGAARGHLGPAH